MSWLTDLRTFSASSESENSRTSSISHFTRPESVREHITTSVKALSVNFLSAEDNLPVMDIESCMLGRRSIRAYRHGDVPDAVIRFGLELANAAPSAGNLQAREFIVVTEASVKKALSEAALGQEGPIAAPVCVVFCANLERIESYGRRGSDLYVLQDVAASIENFLLYIHSQGFGAVWIGAFNESGVSRALRLPHYIRPLAIVPVGIPGEVPSPPSKRPLDEMVHRETWSD